MRDLRTYTKLLSAENIVRIDIIKFFTNHAEDHHAVRLTQRWRDAFFDRRTNVEGAEGSDEGEGRNA